MHKLLEYVCDELEELERKADKGGKLSMAEIQYVDTLAHTKKNLLTADAMMESEYSEAGGSSNRGSYGRGGSNRGGSNMGGSNRGGSSRESYEGGSMDGSFARGRNARRDSMGRYSREGSYEQSYYSREDAKDDLIEQLRQMEQNMPDEETRHMVKKWIKQAEEQ